MYPKWLTLLVAALLAGCGVVISTIPGGALFGFLFTGAVVLGEVVVLSCYERITRGLE